MSLYRLRLDRIRPWQSHRSLSTIIGVRAEDPTRLWERRAPLTPTAVRELVQDGVTVCVQRCEKRIFMDEEYEQAGAQLVATISPSSCDLILGIKEIPRRDLTKSDRNPTYAFFSHTHKGQSYNLPLLQSMIDSQSRYIDYELLTNEHGARTTAFGFLAGAAGMADGLCQFAMKALALGSATPLLHLPRPYMSRSLEDLKTRLREVGEEIETKGTPAALGPITIAISGRGRVGEGAISILNDLPVTWVKANELKRIVESGTADLRKIYACSLELGDYLTNAETGEEFDREEYRRHPGKFRSDFDTKIAPYTTIFLNGAYWSHDCPRILTIAQLSAVRKRLGKNSNRFCCVIDVACDYDGGLEFVSSPTTICDPTIQFDSTTGASHRDLTTPNTTQISSIEILPSQLPLDASRHFSSALLPYIHSLILDPRSKSQTPIAQALRRATIVENGALTEAHVGLSSLLDRRSSTTASPKRKQVLILGSGLVAGPAVDVIAARKDVDLIVASNSLLSAQALIKDHPTARAVLLNASDRDALEQLVGLADVVISLLPAPLHVSIAELCILHHTDFVTASYVSKEMTALDDSARASGVILLNELGLDPGIDHMSAMSLIADAREKGHQINSFVSFCGGLPAPEDSNGLLGYKFSWSPRGVLTAALNPASFRLDSATISIPSKSLLSSRFPSVPIIKGFNFEGIANRDSIKYLKEYGLPADLPTILRGTLRYSGFSEIVDVWKRIGLLDVEIMESKLERWIDLVDVVLHRQNITGSRNEMISRLSGASHEVVKRAVDTLQELSLIPSSHSTCTLPDIPSSPQSPLDLLSIVLAHQLAYSPTERDCVVLHHELGTTAPDNTSVLFTSTMVQYGIPGSYSAMARTVGIPIALGALLCLDGRIKSRGIVSPANEEVWNPLLRELELNGIKMIENRKQGVQGVVDTLRKMNF